MAINPLRDDPLHPARGPQRFGLVLPGGVADDVPGGSLVRRAVSWVVLLFALLLAAALGLAALLEMDVTVTGRGLLEPADVWPVRPRESGTVLSVSVGTGDTVTAGQPLLQLDGFEHRQVLADLRAQWRQHLLEHDKAAAGQPLALAQQRERVAGAEAAVLEARARLRAELVERNFDPNVDSVLSRYAVESGVALDIAVAGLRAAMAEHRGQRAQLQALDLAELERGKERAELELLAGQIAAQRERLDRLVVVAPGGGIVLTDAVHRLVGAQVQAGETLLELGHLSNWRVVLLVSADEIHLVRSGDSVRVDLRAFRRDERPRLDGVVHAIGPEPAGHGAVGQSAGPLSTAGYRVEVALDSGQLAVLGPDRLRRGYAAEGKIVTRSGKALRLLFGYVQDQITR